MVNLNEYRISKADKQKVREAPAHLKMLILRKAKTIPKKKFCPYEFKRGSKAGETCGKGHFQGSKSNFCAKHKNLKAARPMCIETLTRGPNTGQPCPRQSSRDNIRCCRHRGKTDVKGHCEYVLQRGPRRGDVCGKTSCKHLTASLIL